MSQITQPQRYRWRWTFLLPLGLLQCGPSIAQFHSLTQRVESLEQQLQQQQLPVLSRRVTDLEKDVHRAFSETRCQKLDSVRALMEAFQSSTCQPESYTNALRQMQNLPHVLAYLWPEHGVDRLHDDRLLALTKLYDRPLYSWTTLLIVALPPSNFQVDQAQAAASQLLNKLTDIEGSRKVVHMPPATIKCSSGNKSVANMYRQRPADAPKKGEPPAEQAILAWVFLLDC